MAPSVLDLSRAGDSGDLAGAVSEVAAQAALTAGRMVTAVRAGDGTLKLIAWRVDPSGAVTRTGDSGSQAGAATAIDVATGVKTVTACRTGAGNLLLIAWDVPPNGAPARRGDSGGQAGESSRIRLVTVSNDLFVTACRAGDGDLKLISWRVASNGAIRRLADSGDAAGEVTEISLVVQAAVGGGARLVTAVRDGAGDLKVIAWNVTAAGALSRIGDSGGQAGAATLIRAARDAHGNLVTAVRDGSGNLKLISWRVEPDGKIMRLGDSGGAAGGIGDNALTAFADGVLSAVRTTSGILRLIAWSTDPIGGIRRLSDSADQAGVAALIDVVTGDGSTDAAGRSVSAVTAVQAANGNLKLISWRPAAVRVHVKVLTAPSVSVTKAVDSMRQVYASVGIRVVHASTETLTLATLNDLDVGGCSRGSATDEQRELFGHRNNVLDGDVVVYFVRSTVPPLNGCAAHPDGRPGAVVARGATQWTMGHEVGHVLGLNHVTGTDRLMTGGGTSNITNPPPDLIASEASTMQGSPLTDESAGN